MHNGLVLFRFKLGFPDPFNKSWKELSININRKAFSE